MRPLRLEGPEPVEEVDGALERLGEEGRVDALEQALAEDARAGQIPLFHLRAAGFDVLPPLKGAAHGGPAGVVGARVAALHGPRGAVDVPETDVRARVAEREPRRRARQARPVAGEDLGQTEKRDVGVVVEDARRRQLRGVAVEEPRHRVEADRSRVRAVRGAARVLEGLDAVAHGLERREALRRRPAPRDGEDHGDAVRCDAERPEIGAVGLALPDELGLVGLRGHEEDVRRDGGRRRRLE
mmetsp:Transcript_33016/g.112059  ORF Transcript_33016/g.112059 Transcript_33016/m.112059 type:complete len:242 (-) Transcript_33016:63-788(-)